jgi:hypothetical protein
MGAKTAVAAVTGLTTADFQARPAGGGAWYVWERDLMSMPIDDRVWAVLPSGRVVRAVAEGHPFLPATDLTDDPEDSPGVQDRKD